MKNINEIAKDNLITIFDKYELWEDENADKIMDDLEKSQQNLISAFKEMVEELPNVEVETIQGNKRTKVELKAKFTKDLLSSLTEETKHGAGSNCDIDMCPECEKSDNNFSN